MAEPRSWLRRMAIRAIVLFGLGAIINFVVAWGCAYMAEPLTLSIRPVTPREQSSWMRRRPAEFTQTLQVVGDATGKGVTRTSWMGEWRVTPAMSGFSPQLQPPRPGDWIERNDMFAAGWPLRALEGDCWHRRRYAAASKLVVTRVAMIQYTSFGAEILLPMRPIWPGFAINTVLYTGVVWMVFLIPGPVRRWRRVKKGLCGSCGYDLRGVVGGHEACPECGKTMVTSNH